MWSLEQRECAINAYYLGGWKYGQISKELGVPYDTIKTWCTRYRKANGTPTVANGDVKIKKSYKSREKSTEKVHEERIAQLEMEVELLRNFLLTDARG